MQDEAPVRAYVHLDGVRGVIMQDEAPVLLDLFPGVQTPTIMPQSRGKFRTHNNHARCGCDEEVQWCVVDVVVVVAAAGTRSTSHTEETRHIRGGARGAQMEEGDPAAAYKRGVTPSGWSVSSTAPASSRSRGV